MAAARDAMASVASMSEPATTAERIPHVDYLVLDPEPHLVANECTACGICETRCQMDAISMEETARVELDRCIGCGLCVTDCPAEAIRLIQKGPDECYTPPRNIFETYMNIAQERGLI